MQRFSRLAIAATCTLLTLAGCATNPASGNPEVQDRPAATSVDVGVDWAWSIAGDAAVRPLQVFSLQGKTYLQMRPGQMLPAILAEGQPLPFTINAPYIVVQQTPEHMDIVANGYRAVVVHAKQRQTIRQGPVMPDPKASRVQRVSVEDAGKDETPIAHSVTPLFEAPAQSTADSDLAPMERDKSWPVEASKAKLSRVIAAWGKRSHVAVRWNSRADVPVRASGEFRASNVYVAVAKARRAASAKGWTFAMSVESDGSIVVNGYQQGSDAA